MKITRELLEKWGACPDGLEWWDAHYTIASFGNVAGDQTTPDHTNIIDTLQHDIKYICAAGCKQYSPATYQFWIDWLKKKVAEAEAIEDAASRCSTKFQPGAFGRKVVPESVVVRHNTSEWNYGNYLGRQLSNTFGLDCEKSYRFSRPTEVKTEKRVRPLIFKSIAEYYADQRQAARCPRCGWGMVCDDSDGNSHHVDCPYRGYSFAFDDPIRAGTAYDPNDCLIEVEVE